MNVNYRALTAKKAPFFYVGIVLLETEEPALRYCDDCDTHVVFPAKVICKFAVSEKRLLNKIEKAIERYKDECNRD